MLSSKSFLCHTLCNAHKDKVGISTLSLTPIEKLVQLRLYAHNFLLHIQKCPR